MKNLALDERVYYIDNAKVKRGKINGIRKKWYSGIFEARSGIIYEINGEDIKEEDVFIRKSDAFIKMMEVLDFGNEIPYDKIKKACKYLFPEEWADSVEDEDFNTLDIEESKNLIEAWGKV